MFTLSYSSLTTRIFTQLDLSALLVQARTANERRNVTGMLIHRNGRFIQVLEGPQDAVRQIFASITADPRHTITSSSFEVVTDRQFPTWSMGFHSVDAQSAANLVGYDNSYRPGSGAPNAMSGSHSTFDRLYDFWMSDDLRPFIPKPQIQKSDTIPRGKNFPGPGPGPDADAAPAPAQQKQTIAGPSDTVSAIYDLILDEVHTGVRKPGDRVNDYLLAQQLGVSRTPVREALQKLRDVGVVQVAANRFTQITVVDFEEAQKLVAVLGALYGAVLKEVIGRVTADVVAVMREDRAEFDNAAVAGNIIGMMSAAVNFYMRLVAVSDNAALVKHITSAIHLLRLAHTHLEDLIGFDQIRTSTETLIVAVETGNCDLAFVALQLLMKQEMSPDPIIDQSVETFEWTI